MIANSHKNWVASGTIAMIVATILAINVFAAHTEELHESKYYGAPGETIKGQVTILNPVNETKSIRASHEEAAVDDNWIVIPKAEYTMGPYSRVVIRYNVQIPEDAKESTSHDILIKEYFPSDTLSLTHRVSVVIEGDEKSLRGEAKEINILYVTITIMMLVAFTIGLAIGGTFCVKKLSKWLNGGRKKKKRASKRGK